MEQISQINYQLQHFENAGIETKIITTKKQVRLFQSINPVDRLKQNGVISEKQKLAFKNYQHDFARSNQSNHARPNYDDSRSTAPKNIEITSDRLASSKNVNRVRALIDDLDANHYYLKILELLVEQEKSINAANILIFKHNNTKVLLESVKKIALVLENYYSN